MHVAAVASVAAAAPAFSSAGGIAVAIVFDEAVAAAAAFDAVVVAAAATDAFAASVASAVGDAAAAAAVATARVAVVISASRCNSYLKMHWCPGRLVGNQLPAVAWQVQTPTGRVAKWNQPYRDACPEADIGGLQVCDLVGEPGIEHAAWLPSCDGPNPAQERERCLCRTARNLAKASPT